MESFPDCLDKFFKMLEEESIGQELLEDFDDKENIPPLSPLDPGLIYSPHRSKETPNPEPMKFVPTAPPANRPRATEVTQEERQMCKFHHMTTKLSLDCGMAINVTWPGFTFFQLWPGILGDLHRRPPVYKYPVEAFLEALDFKDHPQAHLLGAPKQDGGIGYGYFRSYVQSQETEALTMYHCDKAMDPKDYAIFRSIREQANGLPLLLAFDHRYSRKFYYDIPRFVYEVLARAGKVAFPRYTLETTYAKYVSSLIAQALFFLGPDLKQRLRVMRTFDGNQEIESPMGDPFVVTFFCLFVCAIEKIPFSEINSTFMQYGPYRCYDVWTAAL